MTEQIILTVRNKLLELAATIVGLFILVFIFFLKLIRYLFGSYFHGCRSFRVLQRFLTINLFV